jgi:hypothetical protein
MEEGNDVGKEGQIINKKIQIPNEKKTSKENNF